MTEPRTCPTCRTPIPQDSPGGACPRCLMALGFATDPGAPPPDVPAAEVERRFPGYEITGQLGRGGMGVVFRARQKALDREVALKVLPGGPTRGAQFAERFQREAKALARLQHPGIVQVFDFGVAADGWCFLAMELVDGANLRRVLADRRISPKEALAIVPQMCDALQYAHDQGVVHRDIKPENVLLTKSGRVKVADFGLAKLVEGARGPSLTGTGHVMGTPHYMAPEQVEHPADVDHRADIYSLGVVFYEMLTGELPLGRFAAPSGKCDVDARVDAIVMRTLEKERAARFQHVSEVKTRIDEAGSPLPPPIPLPPRPSRIDVAAAKTVSLQKALFASPGPESRLSKLAFLVPFGAAAAWMTVLGNAHSVSQTLWFTVPTLLALLLASLYAWGRIRHSEGRLHGIGFAGIGVLAAVLLVPMTIWEVVARASQRTYVYPSQSTIEIQRGHAHAATLGRDQAAIRRLLDRTLALRPVTEIESLRDLYLPEDFEALRAMSDEARATRGESGQLGLPLVGDEFFDGDLATYQITTPAVPGDTATVTMWNSSIMVTVQFVRADGAADPSAPMDSRGAAEPNWRFALAPLRKTITASAPSLRLGGDGRNVGPATPKKPR